MNTIFVFGIFVIIVLIIIIVYKLKDNNTQVVVIKPDAVKGCPVNTYLKKGVCVPCPSGYVSKEGSVFLSDCKCGIGYYQDGYNCSPCPADSTTLVIGASSRNQCVCSNAGNYLLNGTCVPCPIGTYLDNDQIECVTCPRNRLTLSEGSTSINDCFCPDGSSINGLGLSTNIGNCRCDSIDYVWDGLNGKCMPCPFGSSLSSTGQQTIYQAGTGQWCKCGANTSYWDNVWGQCRPCPTGSSWPGTSGIAAGTTSCKCDYGRNWNGSACI
jgi:hypothetical protein